MSTGSDPALDILRAGWAATGLPLGELWFRYFALGGMSTALEVDAFLHGALVATDRDRDVLAVAVNERLAEMGGDHPIPYSDDEPERARGGNP
jgi:hypothetical protein